MNSYERVLAAFRREQPDRVPLVEWIIDPKVVAAIHPHAQSQTDFEEIEGFDAVCCGVKFAKVSDRGDGRFVDEWGVLYGPTTEVIHHPIRGPIETKDDLLRYQPPDPNLPHRLGKLPELAARFKRRKAIVFHQRAAFMWSAYLNGLENLLMNFVLEPEFAHELLDMVLEANIQVARNALRAGADIIVLGDDYAGNRGPMFSPAIYRQFLAPRLKRMVDAIHEEGGLAVKHSDGNLWPILEDIVNTGADALNPIEPVAGMDIGEVKRKYGHRVCLVGNIDCSRLLSEGTVEEVERAVIECIRKASPGGGHILASSNSIHSAVKPENYMAMIRAARKYGVYPLEVG